MRRSSRISHYDSGHGWFIDLRDVIRCAPGRIAIALTHRNFRLLWMGALTSSIGTWMQKVAQAQFQSLLFDDNLWPTAHDEDGEVRAVELRVHPFFVATLFQPERRALAGQIPPLALAFLDAVLAHVVNDAV